MPTFVSFVSLICVSFFFCVSQGLAEDRQRVMLCLPGNIAHSIATAIAIRTHLKGGFGGSGRTPRRRKTQGNADRWGGKIAGALHNCWMLSAPFVATAISRSVCQFSTLPITFKSIFKGIFFDIAIFPTLSRSIGFISFGQLHWNVEFLKATTMQQKRQLFSA